MRLSFLQAAAVIACAVLLAGCDDIALPPDPVIVQATVAEITDYTQIISLTGVVAARATSNLSFKTSGRVLERRVNVGDRVTQGQVLALLDPQEQQADMASAQAGVDAANAKLRLTTTAFARQESLIASGSTTRRERDQAEEDLRSAQGALQVAQSQFGIAADALANTMLKAGANSVVTARHIEAGQVVQSAQTAYTLAADGPRDAVFDVYEAIFTRAPATPEILVTLLANPAITAKARIREVSPLLDPVTGTVKVKFEIINAPAEMALGAALQGVGGAAPQRAIILPWTALSSQDGKPAVWLVDPRTRTVSLRRVEILDYRAEQIIVGAGLATGQTIVTKGQQLLYPGQVVAAQTARAL